MQRSHLPIDESSYTDSGSFDPEEMLNPRHSGGYAPSQLQSEWQSTGTDPYALQSQQGYPQHGYVPQDGYAADTPAGANVDATVSATVAATTSGRKAGGGFSQFFARLTQIKMVKFVGMVLSLFAAYAFVVCCSYLFTLDTDQSAVLYGEQNLDLYENAGRKFGAQLAHLLVYNWFGLGAFIFIYYLGVCGLRLTGMVRSDFWSLTLRCLLSTVAFSVVMGLVTYAVASPVYWGGLHGHLLNERLIAYAGIWGAIAVSCAIAGMVVLLYLSELHTLYTVAKHGWSAYSERRARQKAHREALRAEARAKAEAEAALRARQEAEAEAVREAERQAEAARRQVTPQTVGVASVEAAAAVIPDGNVDNPGENLDHDSAVKPATSEVADDDIPALFTSPEDDEMLFTPEAKDEEFPSLFAPSSGNSDHSDISESFDSSDVTVASDDAIERVRPADPRDQSPYDPRADLSHFKFPPLDLLNQVDERLSVDAQEMEENNQHIRKTLADYGIGISEIKATVGPTVTLYEIVPAEGVRVAKIKNLEDDIALSLKALGVRIIAPIPGKGTVGIEVPNKDPQTVSMRSVLASEKFRTTTMNLPMVIGRTVSNEVFMADLCKMPHLLVAGATGMGKSVGLNAIITSLLYKKHPSELKFVLIDPKMVEFSLYAKLERHYLAKLPDEEDAIIVNPAKVVPTLNSLCVEMDNRYALLRDAGQRTVEDYNRMFCTHALSPAKGHRYLPYIVVVVDEFADLIMTAGKDVEQPIARIAQKARAVGMHMILATQRPSTNVITGVIKANFPGRIAFRVFQMVDSRTIIDRPGANQLIGRGDMLFSNGGKIERVQCAFIDTPEVTSICDFIQGQVGYSGAYELPEYVPEGAAEGEAGIASVGDRDALFNECARFIVSSGTASTSSLQRRFSIGYNRAGKIMDQLEAAGIVSPSQGIKGREILVDSYRLESLLEQ